MEKLAGQLIDSITTWSKENPKLLAGLIGSGVLGGAGGAALTSDDPSLSTSENRKRRIKNALIGATLGAGAVGGIAYGAGKLNTALPEQDIDPATKFIESPLARGIGALGVGGIGSAINKGVQNNDARILLNKAKDNLSGKDAIKVSDNSANAKFLREALENAGDAKAPTPIAGKLAKGLGLAETVTPNADELTNLQKLISGKIGGTVSGANKIPMFKRLLPALKRNKYTAGAAAIGAATPEALKLLGHIVDKLAPSYYSNQ